MRAYRRISIKSDPDFSGTIIWHINYRNHNRIINDSIHDEVCVML